MTPSEARNILFALVAKDTFETKEYQAIYESTKALEKQIPKKPNNRGTLGKSDKYVFGDCPDCANGVNYEMQYCDRCGKKIDWSEYETERNS